MLLKNIMYMKRIYIKVLIIVFIVAGISACSNKKLENNIKSLEKRVAALEGKSNIVSSSSTSPNASTVNPVSDANAPVMTFGTSEYDFGTINEGDVVDHTFNFTNTGKTPLIISKATATCGCTVPEWPKQPIAPGSTGVIKVKFNSKNKKNLQTKYVSITANTKPEVTRIKITGNVIPADDTNG